MERFLILNGRVWAGYPSQSRCVTSSQRTGKDDILSFLTSLIVTTLLEISVTRFSAAGETSPLEKNVMLF